MTKEQLEEYDGMLHCLECDQFVPKIHIDPKRVHQNGDVKNCNVCRWIKNHPQKMKFKDFTEKEIVRFLHYFLYDEDVYLNPLADELNRSIDDMIDLYQFIRLGNKPCLIKTTCEYCGEACEFTPYVYKIYKYHYCSRECYYADKTNKIPKGEENQCYNRIDTNCTNCGKPMKIIPYDYNKTNQYGDSHNFCCQQCYWEYRSKYYVGDKSVNYGREFSEEAREKQRENLLQRIKRDDRLDTKIQLSVNNILDNNNIRYIREEDFDYYSVDNYLADYNGIIEVMGDYWHCSPLKYNSEKYNINQTQSKQIHRDKIKYSYITNHYHVPILYLWETDINKNPELCEKLIRLYVSNNLVLPNYHSFNWMISNDEIVLKNTLITPYQDIPVDQYRELIIAA